MTGKTFRKKLHAQGKPGGKSKGQTRTPPPSSTGCSARVAIQERPGSPPQIVDVTASTIPQFLEELANQVFQLAQEKGGQLPHLAIKEVTDNLIHADFRDVAIEIREQGNLVTISDHGEGIPDREKAFLPGYSAATQAHRRHIRGVGAGLGLVKEIMQSLGGEITLGENLSSGTVVTLSLGKPTSALGPRVRQLAPSPQLSERRKKVLLLLAELGQAGPSAVSSELGVSLTTAHRDLSALEEMGLVGSRRGKRILTQEGIKYLDVVFK